MDIHGKVHAPILKLIAQEVLSLVRSDYDLRKIQGANAQQACYPDAKTLGAGAFVDKPYSIVEANSGNEIFTSLVITFDTTAGTGRYRVDGAAATTGVTGGHNIPAGGGVITITGHNNIKQFSMINDSGQTLPFFRNLYK